jgi:DNA helicase-2/ATP-dependent DNA helicase PcrA
MNGSESRWTSQQLAVFDEVLRGSGHLVIRALAGTGKSSTLLESIRRLRAVKPNARVLYAAFNVNVVEEFKARVSLNGRSACDVMTTNGLGHRLLCSALGRSLRVGPRAFKAARDLVGYFDRERGEFVRGPAWKGSIEREDGTWTPNADGSTVRALSKLAEHARNWLAGDVTEVEDIAYRFNLDEALEPYTLTEAASLVWSMLTADIDGEIDYTDQLWLPWFLEARPAFRYDYVFGDESQDWNPAQFDLVRRVSGRRIIMALDENQALYEWRGAMPDAGQQMAKELKAKTLPLTTTFRCPRAVVRLAQQIVPEYEAMEGAREGTVRSVGVDAMLSRLQPGDVILSRSNAPIVGLCMKLLRDRIPAFVRGRDVGGELATLIRRSKKREVEELRSWLKSWLVRETAKLLDRGADDMAIEWVEDKYAACLAMLEGQPSVQAALNDIERLFSDDAAKNRIVLSTVHRFKGQEAERVWLLRWTFLRRRKGESQPSAEERRIFYVGVTRSKSELYLVEGGGDDER